MKLIQRTFLQWLFIVAVISSIPATAIAQKAVSQDELPVFTADSLASGSTKDILTSFFQLAFDNLTGPDKALNFNSNPFAIMLRSDPTLAKDVNYYKYRFWRKLNFGFGIKLDTSYHFNGFSAGIKYALINQRDSTTSKLLFKKLVDDSLNVQLMKLEQLLNQYVSTHFSGASPDKTAFINGLQLIRDTAFSSWDKKFADTVLNIARVNKLTVFVQQVTTSPNVSLQSVLDASFSDMKASIKNRLLWTVGISDTTYQDQFAFSNVVFATALSKGIFKPKPGSNLELNILASLNLLNDSLRTGHNLKRCILDFQPGVNWVIRNKNNDQSLLEFQLNGEYSHNFSSLYTGEKRDKLWFNGIFRVRVIDDIWIPLSFKYDPDNGRVFGFLSVKANFTGMGKLIKEMTK